MKYFKNKFDCLLHCYNISKNISIKLNEKTNHRNNVAILAQAKYEDKKWTGTIYFDYESSNSSSHNKNIMTILLKKENSKKELLCTDISSGEVWLAPSCLKNIPSNKTTKEKLAVFATEPAFSIIDCYRRYNKNIVKLPEEQFLTIALEYGFIVDINSYITTKINKNNSQYDQKIDGLFDINTLFGYTYDDF